jgi:hypothetical protein
MRATEMPRRNLGIYPVFIFIFNDMGILNAETFHGAQHGAGIVRLENIFKRHHKIPGALRKHLLKAVQAVWSGKPGKIIN